MLSCCLHTAEYRMLPGGRGMPYLIPALCYSDTYNWTVDELYSSCRLLGLWRTKVKVHFRNSRCLRKVINNSNAVLCIDSTQGESISQTRVRNVFHISYKGELTTQTTGNIFPSMCSMCWNKSYFNSITTGTARHQRTPVFSSEAVCCCR